MKPPFRYVQSFVDKKTGAVFHYFRRPGFPRKRLPGLRGSREFMAAYQDALDQPQIQIGAKRTRAGTVSAAIVGYYGSTMFFGALAPGTQAMRRPILERFRAEHGDRPIGTMPPKFIALMLNKMKPFAARNWLKTIRHLMQFCVAQEMIATDPTLGVKLPRAKSDGIYTWTEAEIAQFEARHAPGTKERLALALLL